MRSLQKERGPPYTGNFFAADLYAAYPLPESHYQPEQNSLSLDGMWKLSGSAHIEPPGEQKHDVIPSVEKDLK